MIPFPFLPGRVEAILSYEVYNRWGGQLYKQDNFSPDQFTLFWDGYFNGKIADNGVYVYLIKIKYLDGEIAIFKGGVIVLK